MTDIATSIAETGMLALAVSSTSMTIAKAKVFQPMRSAIARRTEWLGDLVSCPYCVSHWIALAAVLVYQPRVVVSGNWYVDSFVAIMAVVALAAVWSGLIFQLLA